MVVSSARALPLPATITRGGGSGWLAALVAGVIFGGVTLLIPSLLARDTAFGLLAILLGMIASVYLGYALNDGRLRAFQIEYVGIVAFAALATIALARDSAVLLALVELTQFPGHPESWRQGRPREVRDGTHLPSRVPP